MRSLKISKSITNRESESLEKYLQEIGRVEMISPEEEVRLATLIKQGDQKALDKLTKANLRFVVSVAKQYQNQGLTLPDLINEGNLGLIKAAQRFDETRGFKFISYGVWWIRQSIMQAIAEQSRIVRLPLNKVGLTNRIGRTYSQLEQEFERAPTAEEIAEVLNIDIEEVSATMRMATRHVSMDSPLSDGEENTLMDVLVNGNAESADKQIMFNDSLRQEIQRSLTSLSAREREVICCFYGIGVDEPVSLEELGLKYGLTRERVRQIKDKALGKLKTFTGSNLLREYMGV
ncbi:MAG TPA: RNA polymerase sigma factor RpoD/SigA [Hanamia sp.]|jgi:RNA polymerase primary sigma factor|nr:RNA polymerase sigma factor RpoD/SigA [Hanamia sp.]